MSKKWHKFQILFFSFGNIFFKFLQHYLRLLLLFFRIDSKLFRMNSYSRRYYYWRIYFILYYFEGTSTAFDIFVICIWFQTEKKLPQLTKNILLLLFLINEVLLNVYSKTKIKTYKMHIHLFSYIFLFCHIYPKYKMKFRCEREYTIYFISLFLLTMNFI